MASTELTTAHLAPGGSAGALIRRPAELVELSELVYRGIFSAGLVVASIGTGYAAILATLQPAGHRLISILVCSLLLIAEFVAWRRRVDAYGALRRRPWLMLIPGLVVGAAAFVTGSHNEQAFYVLVLLIGPLGVASSLRAVGAAALVAGVGLAAPHALDGSWTIGMAVAAAVCPPLFWLIVEQLARFMLRLHRTMRVDHDPPAAPLRVRNLADDGPPAWSASADREPPDNEPEGLAMPDLAQAARDTLSSRQLQVMLLVAEGLQNVEIARCLDIGAAQVGRHLSNARRKAGVATDAELMAWAKRHGIVPPADETG